MPCFYPLQGWRSRRRTDKGKRSIVFVKSEGYADQAVQVPCGQCIGCRLEHSRQWAIRCMHEAELHSHNEFLTLTYSDENIPQLLGEPTLKKTDFQLFMKRLRKKYGNGIKYYACGEYGDHTGRPHYHACVFGLAIKDKVEIADTGEYKIYGSKTIEDLWGLGHITIGEVNFETAAYVARYCMKKKKGKDAKTHYERVNPETGEILMIQPEFALMSRRPGIGKKWLDKFKQEVIANDSVIVRSREMKPPKYYDSQFEKEELEKYELMKAKRIAAAKKALENNSLARLHVRAQCKEQQIKDLKKGL